MAHEPVDIDRLDVFIKQDCSYSPATILPVEGKRRFGVGMESGIRELRFRKNAHKKLLAILLCLSFGYCFR